MPRRSKSTHTRDHHRGHQEQVEENGQLEINRTRQR